MPCTTESLSNVRCNDQALSGESRQRNIWRQFLCLIAAEVDPDGGACTSEALLSDARALACQGGAARQRLIQASVICANLDVECNEPLCLSVDEEEAMISILVCRIVNAIE